MEAILRLLRLSNQDAAPPCHIITAVTTRAASAAADLRSSGDYAIAYPTSTIMYHGLRRQETGPLTQETTSMLANVLRRSNDFYAMELARKIEDRFSFRFLASRSEFADIRTALSNQSMSDVDCFVDLVGRKLSSGAQEVWNKAKERQGRYSDLFNFVRKKIKRDVRKMSMAQLEGVLIRAIVDFELKNNRSNPDWSFKGDGMDDVANDFFLLDEFLGGSGGERLRKWCISWGKYILPDTEVKVIDAVKDDEQKTELLVQKVSPLLQPLSSFFVALCHALQEGENELTAIDAYWLGLVDEVVGEELLCLRSLEEFKPDPQPATPVSQLTAPEKSEESKMSNK